MVEPMEHMSDMNVKRTKPTRVATPGRVEFSRIRNLRAFEEIVPDPRHRHGIGLTALRQFFF